MARSRPNAGGSGASVLEKMIEGSQLGVVDRFGEGGDELFGYLSDTYRQLGGCAHVVIPCGGTVLRCV